MAWTDEKRKAFGEKMKAAREAKRAAQVEAPIAPEVQADSATPAVPATPSPAPTRGRSRSPKKLSGTEAGGSLDDKIAAAVESVLAKVLPVTAGVMSSQMAQVQNLRTAEMQMAMANSKQGAKSYPRCAKCGQEERACKGKHRMVVAFPGNFMLAKGWQGYFLNGVKYDSGSPGRKICVPEECDIESAIATYESAEADLLNGTVRKREHVSGEIGNGSSGFRSAVPSGSASYSSPHAAEWASARGVI